MGAFSWVTLATNDSYSLGAMVLAHSLKQVGTVHQLTVLITSGVSTAMREKLESVFNVVQEVNILDSRDEANLRLLKRPELGITFTKLHCWLLTQYEKCVFLDADTLVLQNCDELFEREELSAAPDVGWPDCFNSGVFVYRPSVDTYDKLIQFALEKGSFDGGDQGLLNLYFSDWAHKDISKHLPFIYNMCSTACYSYLPAFKQFGSNAKIVHFIGVQKPWLQYFNTETRQVQPSGDSSHLQEVLQRWWDIFCTQIHPHLSPAMAGLAGAFSNLTLGVPMTPQQDAFEDVLRKQSWEVGNIDYLGKDSFDNIWSKISQTLNSAPTSTVPETSTSAQGLSQAAMQEEAIPVQPSPLLDITNTNHRLVELNDESHSDVKTSSTCSSIGAVLEPAQTLPETVNLSEAKEKALQVLEPIVSPTSSNSDKLQEVEPSKIVYPTIAGAPQVLTEQKSVENAQEVGVTEPQPTSLREVLPVSVGKKFVEGVAECSISPKEDIVDTENAPNLDLAPLQIAATQVEGDIATQSPIKSVHVDIAPKRSVQTEVPEAVQTRTMQGDVPPLAEGQQILRVQSPGLSVEPPSVPSSVTDITSGKAEATAIPTELSNVEGQSSAITDATAQVQSSNIASRMPTEGSAEAKNTETIPPVTPITPPMGKTKQALTVQSTILDTPPPSEGGSTPMPPPAKTNKQKKNATKAKK